ncbi:hypothetical protein [Dapis sp. BLCC M229]|uniref:hypothetical protein n=1 Tax=Dapis sp. BLCC M229 TaxID=3400188 RepID=UPI003CF036AD
MSNCEVRSERNGVERSNLNGFTLDSRDCHVTLPFTRNDNFSLVALSSHWERNRVERSNLNGFTVDSRDCHITLRFTRNDNFSTVKSAASGTEWREAISF